MPESPLDSSSLTPQKPAGTGFFFVLALGMTWTLQLPALLARYGVLPGSAESYMHLMALGGFGPLVAAIIASWREGGSGGIRALFRPDRAGRVGAPWYAVALVLFPAIHLAGVAVFKGLGGDDAQWLYLPENPQHLAAMVMFPLVEEPGWRGFALPGLQQRMSPLAASLTLGLLWAAWHTVMFVLQGFTPLLFLLAVVNIVAGSVVFSWLWNRTRGSLLVAVVAHVGVHLNNPTHALPHHPTPFLVYTAAICVAACALVLLDRRPWQRRAPLDDGLPATPGNRLRAPADP